jgi:hypothetical protein
MPVAGAALFATVPAFAFGEAGRTCLPSDPVFRSTLIHEFVGNLFFHGRVTVTTPATELLCECGTETVGSEARSPLNPTPAVRVPLDWERLIRVAVGLANTELLELVKNAAPFRMALRMEFGNPYHPVACGWRSLELKK